MQSEGSFVFNTSVQDEFAVGLLGCGAVYWKVVVYSRLDREAE